MQRNYFFTGLLIAYFIFPLHATGQQQTDPLWFKKSIIYNLDVHTYKDSNGDGMGDFRGLTEQLGYLKDLGVDVLWLAPFQPSPMEDDGYDVADYYKIDSLCGTKEDFKAFMEQTRRLGLKVITDVVLNHTSDKHPWFVQASTDTTSKYYNWYSWTRKRPSNYNEGMAFPGVQKEIWTYVPSAKAYYYHRFYEFQPDLNFRNPAVQAEGKRILAYWLQQGVDGFRLDAVPFMLEDAVPGEDKPPQNYTLLYNYSKFVKSKNKTAVLLGEANVSPEQNKKYFGKQGDGLQMMFNFYVNQYLFYALATGKTGLLQKALITTREHPANTQFAYFLRNHDEIDLGRLTKEQREEVNKVMGPEKDMQLYDRGIRRRLAPMLNNDPKLLGMAYSFLMALPGTPVIRSGDEIGMGDDLNLKERIAVRTPMQWSDADNAGFTSAKKPFRPVISKGEYSYKKVNVERESADSNSLLTQVKRLVQIRKSCPEVGQGSWKLLDVGDSSVVAFQYNLKGRKVITLHNFGKTPTHATIKLPGSTTLNCLNLHNDLRPSSTGKYDIELEGYGYRWFTTSK